MNGSLQIARPNIRIARLERGMSQAALAECCSLTQSRICFLERGLQANEWEAEAIARALGHEVGDLFPEFEDPEQAPTRTRTLKRRKVV